MAKATFYYAAKLGYFEKIKRGHYRSKVNIFEPFHARKILDEMYNKINQIKIAKGERTGRNIKPINKPTVAKKTFSLFWGLIKITF